MDHPTIFHGYLASDLPESEKASGRLAGEGQTVVAAGSITTAHYLKAVTYHILANSEVLKTLRAELDKAIPRPHDIPPFKDLESLPYLSAVVKEGFRITHGIIARLTSGFPVIIDPGSQTT